MAMPGMPEVDAVVVQDSDIYLIEAKITREWENLGKITIYRDLLPQTPGWEGVDIAKIHMRLVLAKPSPAIRAAAAARGVEVEEYLTPRAREILEKGWPSQR